MQNLSPTEKQEVAQIIMGLFEKKIMHPLSGEKFPLSKFNQAIAKSQEDAHGGKVLLVNDEWNCTPAETRNSCCIRILLISDLLEADVHLACKPGDYVAMKNVDGLFDVHL